MRQAMQGLDRPEPSAAWSVLIDPSARDPAQKPASQPASAANPLADPSSAGASVPAATKFTRAPGFMALPRRPADTACGYANETARQTLQAGFMLRCAPGVGSPAGERCLGGSHWVAAKPAASAAPTLPRP
jgi:hypothetical protein